MLLGESQRRDRSGSFCFRFFQEESLDVVRSAAVCEKQIVPNETAVGRAGAVAEFAQNRVLLCGGRDHQVSPRS